MRKGLVHLLALSLVCAFGFPLAGAVSAQTVNPLERGYRTGYSDGYVAGYRDTVDHAQYDFKNNPDFRKADRAYIPAYGPVEDFRDGYQQGFSVGYDDGFQSRGFNSTIPKNIARKGTIDDDDTNSSSSSGSSTSGGGITASSIPKNTVLLVELLDELSSERSQKGDRFQARIMEPAEFEGAIIEGHVERVQRPGKVSGTAQLQLAFDTIRVDTGADMELKAQVVEVVPLNPGDKVETADSEGGIKGRASKTKDAVKVGFGTAVGAIIGAIAGGGKGAAIGAAIGGGATGASVLSSRGSDIKLDRGQQLRIRTTASARLN